MGEMALVASPFDDGQMGYLAWCALASHGSGKAVDGRKRRRIALRLERPGEAQMVGDDRF